ncbi:mechanosensitive ion channel [bacterium]|nr:mechanosensitive ion channel [bacterium]
MISHEEIHLDEINLKSILLYLDRILHYQLFKINDTDVTISSLLIFIILFAALMFLSKLASNLLEKHVLTKMMVDTSSRYRYRQITYYILMTFSILFSLQFIGIDLSGLAVIFGLLSVGIGFGLQNVTSNFISGIILLFEQPIKVGDRVTVNDTLGEIVEINMRSTTITTLQNVSIIVPNSDFISSQVVNWSHRDPKIRLEVDVGVSYNSDLDMVLKVMKEVALEHKNILKNPEPEVLHRGFGDSAWDMQLRAWIDSPEGQFRIISDLNCAIVRKFRENNIEIPFPQRDLHVRSSIAVPLGIESAAAKEISVAADRTRQEG